MPDSSSPAVNPVHRASAAAFAGSEPWSVICDFDGTIATVDVTDELLTRFALPEWQTIEAQWKAGEISARECMAQQIALLRVSRTELYAHLAHIHIDPGFREFVADCRGRQLPMQVVSDGIDRVIRRVLLRNGFGEISIAANRLIHTGRDTYELQFPNAKPGCSAGSGTCKCAVAAQAKPRRVLLIGDGTSDFCLARNADFVFAKAKLRTYCEQQGIAHRAFDTFSDIRYLLSELLDHPHHHHRPLPLANAQSPTWSI